MPAARPVWKGQLRLSLVSIGVELYAAKETSAKPGFRQIHGPSGQPVSHEKVVPGVGSVAPDDIQKGFEVDKGEFVMLTNEEVDAIKLETRKTIELTQFVEAGEIDPLYYDKAYFVAPADALAVDAFRVIRDALKSSRRIGIGQLALRGREYLAAVQPYKNGLLLETLYYADEVRSPDPYFALVKTKKADPELVDIARQLIDKRTAKFNAAIYQDNFQLALRDLVKQKLASRENVVTRTTLSSKTDPDAARNLMEALRQSVKTTSRIRTARKPTPLPATEGDQAGKAEDAKTKGGRKTPA